MGDMEKRIDKLKNLKGRKIETITGKKVKIIWIRDELVSGLPSIIVEFENGQKQDYTPEQFDKVFSMK